MFGERRALALVLALMSVLIARSTAGAALYPWDSLTPDFYVDPAKATNGAGTLGDPYQPSQGLAIGPHASRDRVILWLPGDYNVTTVNPSDRKWAAIYPQDGASATRRVIHKAQNPGSTVDGLRTRIRRTSGAGVIFGFYLNSYAVWDGFMCDTVSGEPTTVAGGGAGEVGQVSFRNSDNCKFIRCYLDSQGDTYDGGDRNNIFGQECVDMEVGDCTFLNIGTQETDPSAFSNWTLLMWYDCDGMEIHHCDFSDGPTGIWIKGQHPVIEGFPQVRRHNYHHNVFRNLGVGVRVSSPSTDVEADYSYITQNIFYGNQFDVALTQPNSAFSPLEPSGVVVVNNTMANGTEIQPGAYSTQSAGMVLISDSGGYRDGHQIFRNNIVYNKQTCVFLFDTGSVFDECRWDYNLYNTFTNLCQKGEGGPTENFATWSSTHTPQRDEHGLTSSPSFVNGASNDFRLQGGSAALNAGTDYANLLGGGTSAAINLGAYITSDMSDVFGPRLS